MIRLNDILDKVVTYNPVADLDLIRSAGRGRIDVTVGSALDIFGGRALRYQDLVTRHGNS